MRDQAREVLVGVDGNTVLNSRACAFEISIPVTCPGPPWYGVAGHPRHADD